MQKRLFAWMLVGFMIPSEGHSFEPNPLIGLEAGCVERSAISMLRLIASGKGSYNYVCSTESFLRFNRRTLDRTYYSIDKIDKEFREHWVALDGFVKSGSGDGLSIQFVDNTYGFQGLSTNADIEVDFSFGNDEATQVKPQLEKLPQFRNISGSE